MASAGITQKTRDTTAQTPTAIISPHGRTGDPSMPAKALGIFSGEVWLDLILRSDEATIGLVNFLPSGRTAWHRHEKGQILKVTGGAGWLCDQGQKPRRIAAGDVVYCPPGVVHWHGADDGTYMVHEATSFGQTDWYEEVSDKEYAAKESKSQMKNGGVPGEGQ
ncbi:hypothetical protein HRR93_008988 [Exophiala dermatitidis]|nr:hypothetical protein HRR93_008988 [Exophiala dermatitidis]